VRVPNALRTCTSSRGSVAIVIVVQWSQPPLVGVSPRRSGYGLCAYASSRACAFAMPSIQSTGETPPVAPRGAVTPPATWDPGLTAWIAAYAGFRSFVTYVAGVVGRSQRRWFGSFQIVQSRTYG
jgi:hypothetical protein